jgi:uncharacterized protein YbjT (DUF2867 family)
MIVVTAAAGFSGRNVARALKRRGFAVRALVKNPGQAAALAGEGFDDVVAGDLRDPAFAARALSGASTLYFICPRFAEDEPALGRLWIAAAEAARLPRFVYQGVAHPYIREMPHHWDKLQVQLALERSSLPFAVIQPTNYMRNVTWAWDRLVEDGVYRLPYSADAPLSWVDADDVAEAAARVLTEPGHDCAIYELCGTDGGLSRTQICALLSECLDRPIRAEVAAWEDWRRLPRYRGWSDGQMARLKAMFDYYDAHGFRAGNTRVLGMLLGRAPLGYGEYLDGLMRLPSEQRQAVQ